MINALLRGLLVAALLLGLSGRALAQDDVPEPFCGTLDDADCDLLAASNQAMLDLAAYGTDITYTLELAGLDEIVDDEATVTLTVSSAFALDATARQGMRRLAVIAQAEPLAVMEAIAADPMLLLGLVRGLGADLSLTLALSPKAIEALAADAETPVPAEVNVVARFVDGILYVNIAELKAVDESLAGYNDWIAYELLASLEQAAADGVFAEAAAAMTTVVGGGPPTGLTSGLIGLLASARATLGQPQVLEQYMTIARAADVELDAGQAGARFRTEFDVLDFVLSDDFRNLLLQTAEVLAAEQGESVDAEAQEAIALFWFVAPALFRDLTVEGTTTVGADDQYVHAGQAIFDWDLTALLRLLASMGELPSQTAERSYIRFTVDTDNRDFGVAQSIQAPAAAQIMPVEAPEVEGLP